jgi:cell division protein ZapA
MAGSESVASVRIYDRDYALRTSGDAERLRTLARILDQRMRELAASTGTVDTLKLAILAALSLGEELERTRQELRAIDETLGRRSLECVSLLERFLHPKSA